VYGKGILNCKSNHLSVGVGVIRAIAAGLGVRGGAPDGITVGFEMAEEQPTVSNAMLQASPSPKPTSCHCRELSICVPLDSNWARPRAKCATGAKHSPQ
jgi:hypothetical protein